MKPFLNIQIYPVRGIKTSIYFAMLAAGLSLLSPRIVSAQQGVTAERIEQISTLADGYAETLGFNGALLVGWGDDVVLRKAYGLANAELAVSNTPTTRFRLASVSKQFTAAALLVLEERGLVDLNAPISTYLPKLKPELGDVITLHQVLSHSSGLVRDIEELTEENVARRYVPVAEIIELLNTSDLRFEPGSQWSYSNPGYAVAAAVIESVTGTSYGEALDTLLFNPLGMTNTGHETASDVIPNLASGYVALPDGLIKAAYEQKSYVIGAGSIYSTIDDLFVWSRALIDGKVLTPENRERLFSRQIRNYSYGWFVDTYVWPPDVANTAGLSIHHGGDSPGFTSNVALYVDHGLVAIFLANVVPSRGTGLYNQVANILLGFDESLPSPPDQAAFYDALFADGVDNALALSQQWVDDGDKYRVPREGEVYVVGRGYLDANEFDRAILVMDFLIAQRPTWTYPYLFKAIALTKAGDTLAAIPVFDKVLELDPGQSNAQSWLRKLGQ